ncbi:cytochrome c [Mariprofundus erugo]|nr:cytochrome c [Mariprofundus erugo]
MLFITLLLPGIAMAASNAKENYGYYCVQCHGMKGNGMGLNIKDMSVQPRDHTDAKAMGARSDDEIFKVIKEGGQSISKSVLMPPWGDTFSDEEIHDLVKYLRSLCNCKLGG